MLFRIEPFHRQRAVRAIRLQHTDFDCRILFMIQEVSSQNMNTLGQRDGPLGSKTGSIHGTGKDHTIIDHQVSRLVADFLLGELEVQLHRFGEVECAGNLTDDPLVSAAQALDHVAGEGGLGQDHTLRCITHKLFADIIQRGVIVPNALGQDRETALDLFRGGRINSNLIATLVDTGDHTHGLDRIGIRHFNGGILDIAAGHRVDFQPLGTLAVRQTLPGTGLGGVDDSRIIHPFHRIGNADAGERDVGLDDRFENAGGRTGFNQFKALQFIAGTAGDVHIDLIRSIGINTLVIVDHAHIERAAGTDDLGNIPF